MKLLLNKKITVLLLLAYVYLVFFGLLGVGMHNHMSETPCPYMMGMNVVCGMSGVSHITFWNFILSVFPSFVFILTLIVCVYYVIKKLFYISPHILRNFLYMKNRESSPVYVRVEEDYSDGRINPKPY